MFCQEKKPQNIVNLAQDLLLIQSHSQKLDYGAAKLTALCLHCDILKSPQAN